MSSPFARERELYAAMVKHAFWDGVVLGMSCYSQCRPENRSELVRIVGDRALAALAESEPYILRSE
jgi:hypothetical protein